MLSKYGIEMQEKGCVTSPSEEAYAHVYNALMEEAIFRKHGRSFEELFAPVWQEITKDGLNTTPVPAATAVTPAADPPAAPSATATHL